MVEERIWFGEVEDVEADFEVFGCVLNTEEKPLGVS